MRPSIRRREPSIERRPSQRACAGEAEAGAEHVALEDGEVDGARRAAAGPAGRPGQPQAAAVRRGRVFSAASRRALHRQSPRGTISVDLGRRPAARGRRPSAAAPARTRGGRRGRPAAAAGEPASEVRQVEVERHAVVVEQELAADDHQALDRARCSRAAAAAAEPRDVVAAGAEGRVGVGVDPQSRRPSMRTRESTMRSPRQGARLGRTRASGISRKGGASGVGPPTRRPRSSSSSVVGRSRSAPSWTGRSK